MKKVTQDSPFERDIIIGSGAIVYALVNKIEVTDEDGVTTYVADAIKVESDKDANKLIKEYSLDTITTDEINGNIFYGDDKSRVDLLTVLVLKLTEDLDDDTEIDTAWKCKNGIVTGLTVGDLKGALHNSISKKGTIIGVS